MVIMANSSFSWWASYLGGGKTVAPKTWLDQRDHKTGKTSISMSGLYYETDKKLNKTINDIVGEYTETNELFKKQYDLLVEAFIESGEHDRYVASGVKAGTKEYDRTLAFLVGLWNVFERSGLVVEHFSPRF